MIPTQTDNEHAESDLVLEQLCNWGQRLEGFKKEHARNALLVVRGYVNGVRAAAGQFVVGIGDSDAGRLLLFAKDLTWTFWLDEWFDGQQEVGADLDLHAIVSAILGGPGGTPAAEGFVELARAFECHEQKDSDTDLWRQTAAAAVTAWSIESRLSVRRMTMTYAEYIENGVNSTAVPHIVATASMLYRFDMSTRMQEERIRRLVRNLSISCRLHNDLFSVEKERAEGCQANAVLLLESLCPSIGSKDFVASELAGYERMIEQDVNALGGKDPFARLATIMPASHQILYTSPTTAYRMTT